MSDADDDEVGNLTKAIAPIFAGRDPAVTCAVLADLIAMTIAGHRTKTKEETDELHRTLLRGVVRLIRKLIPPNVAMIDECIARGQMAPPPTWLH